MLKKALIGVILVSSIILVSYITIFSPLMNQMDANTNLKNTPLTDNEIVPENMVLIPLFTGSYLDITYESEEKLYPNNPSKFSIDEVIKELNSYIEGLFPKTGIPGASVVVVYQDNIVYIKTFGVKKVGENDPINLDTIFQIGSCTKAFTSATIAALVDNGIMSWDDLARQYYPDPAEFALQDPLATNNAAIRDLLSHRTGMYDGAGNEHVLDFLYDFPETLYRMRYIAPDSEFKTKYAYNNIMYSLAGQCSARASSMDWGALVEQKIFTPLNMASSVPYLQDFINNPNHAETHYIVDGITYHIPSINLDPMGPAGSISSSIKDMGNWLRFQLNEGKFNGQQVVSSESLSETHKPHILIESNPSNSIWYALGWGIRNYDGKTYIEHAGSTRLSRSFTSFLPSEGLGIVVLANEGSSATFCPGIAYNLYKIYFNYKNSVELPSNSINTEDGFGSYKPLLDEPVDLDVPPIPIENYAGTYYSDYYGNIKFIKVNDTSLALYPGNNPEPTPVSHVSGNTFRDDYYDKEIIFSKIVNNTPQEVLTKRWEVNGANGTFYRA